MMRGSRKEWREESTRAQRVPHQKQDQLLFLVVKLERRGSSEQRVRNTMTLAPKSYKPYTLVPASQTLVLSPLNCRETLNPKTLNLEPRP